MNSIKFIRAAVAVMLSLSACAVTSCRRAPIYNQIDNVRIQFTYDLSQDDTTMFIKPKMPTIMRVLFYDAETHVCVSENVFHAEGGKVAGLLPGKYDVVAYNYDSEITAVDGEQNFLTIRAHTSEQKMDTDTLGKVIRQPDHLLAGRNFDVDIPYLVEGDSAFVIKTDISTILDGYTLQIDSLKGIENITSVSVYLTGHSSENLLGSNERSTEPTTLSIPCAVDLANNRLYSVFNTFGKIPDTPARAVIHVVVSGPGGTVYDFDEDITEQYNSPSHHLKLSIHGYIKPLPQSEFDPDVNEWDDKETHVDII